MASAATVHYRGPKQEFNQSCASCEQATIRCAESFANVVKPVRRSLTSSHREAGPLFLGAVKFTSTVLKGRKRHQVSAPVPSGAPGLHVLLNHFGITFRFDYPHTSDGRECENGGLDPSWMDLAFLGRPLFSAQRSQYTCSKGFWDLWTENRGAPKTPNPTTTDRTLHSRPS